VSVSVIGGLNAFQRATWGPATNDTKGTSFEAALASVAQNPSPETKLPAPATSKGSNQTAPHMFAPNDSLNQHLTRSDRAAFSSLYGVDLLPDGGIAVPLDMDYTDQQAVLAAAGQLASARAHGTVSDSDVSLDYIRSLVQGFREKIDQGLPLFGEDPSDNHIDVNA
jgi:hypothetical protein